MQSALGNGWINLCRRLDVTCEKKRILRYRKKKYKKVINYRESKNFLIKIWQLIFFCGVSITLIILYLNEAWKPIRLEKITITGISGLSRKDIEKAAINYFPRNLLESNPKEIEELLLRKLPIKAVSINRRFFPSSINLNILEREPIAFASRALANKKEKGMIDIEGYWIPLKLVKESKKNKINISIEGWQPDKTKEIALIIKNRFSLQSQLQKIIFNPYEGISIKTDQFNSVLLGSNTDQLIEQIHKLNVLQESLPNLLINTKVNTVDLRDPSKPELKTEKKLEE